MLKFFITQAGTAHRPVLSGLGDITPTLVTRIILMATRGASGVVITAEAGTLARTGEVAATTEGTIGTDGAADTDGAAGTSMIDRWSRWPTIASAAINAEGADAIICQNL